jgi:uracil-DNA glycosylase family 4
MTAKATDQTRAPKRILVSKLQHGWLQAMGVDAPWITTQPPAAPSLPTKVTEPVQAETRVSPRPSLSMPAAPVNLVPEQAIHLDGLNIAELAGAVHACQRCGLCEARQHAVPGHGVDQPTILIVGEAPGEQEDAQGKPFVGRSGQLLDNMLKAIGHDRNTSVYITNVVKCRPPANRNPRDEEIAACAPYLSRQIELLRPKVILAMGRFAAHALLKTDTTLQQLRQSTHAFESAAGVLPVVVTYHPAYLLRRPADKHLAWEDLKRLRALAPL